MSCILELYEGEEKAVQYFYEKATFGQNTPDQLVPATKLPRN